MTTAMTTNAQRGFTLIELLVGMVILSSIFVGVFGMFQTQLATSINNQDETALQASVQAVVNMIEKDIAMAGFGDGGAQPLAHTDGAAGQPDTLVITSSAGGGNSANSFVITGGTGIIGPDTALSVRCWGPDNLGGAPDPLRDIVYDANRPMTISFVDPFTLQPLAGVGGPVFTVQSSAPGITGATCSAGPRDLNLDPATTPDPVIDLVVSPGHLGLPHGALVYGNRAPLQTTYSLNTTTAVLNQNGTPLLIGVEDFQLRYQVLLDEATGASEWRTDLAGVDTTMVMQVQIGMVVRTPRRDALGLVDPRTSITTFNNTIPLTVDARQFPRKQYIFSVRPKNNGA